MKNYIGIIRDHSGSMNGKENAALQDYNSFVKEIKAVQKNDKIPTRVFVYPFSPHYGAFNRTGEPVSRELLNDSLNKLKTLNTWPCNTGTPLYSAMVELIQDMLRLPDANDPDSTFLVVVVTDGQEMHSRYGDEAKLRNLIAQVRGTGRWTITVQAPNGDADRLGRLLGLEAGNILEYDEKTSAGLTATTVIKTQATQNYRANLSRGVKSTETFYADVSGIKKKDLKKLKNLSGQFKRWKCNNSAEREMGIKALVEKRRRGKEYVLGQGFYQLVKKEKLAAGKMILIRDKSSGDVYGGSEARELLGIPDDYVNVEPGMYKDYEVFVQSTSINRKVPVGSYVMYREV